MFIMICDYAGNHHIVVRESIKYVRVAESHEPGKAVICFYEHYQYPKIHTADTVESLYHNLLKGE